MALQICIWDSSGRRICYENVRQAAAKTHYWVRYYEHGASGRVDVTDGEIDSDAADLVKLKALIDAVLASHYAPMFASKWDRITIKKT